jgi:hypothetical protein
MAMGRKKFNMDPKKVLVATGLSQPGRHPGRGSCPSRFQKWDGYWYTVD